MAIEYGVFIVDGLDVKQQTLSLAGETIGLTNAEGFKSVQNGPSHWCMRSQELGLRVGGSSPRIPTTPIKPSF